ncbi:alpha/beta fold hydrolase [Ideonella sp. 4Y11]|uniref:Alpha/beta fold hydrolase n=1 Tax=Ideonella aquatica TaxID=2824119 RepID=A0A941BSD8_9BURK|nr:alpha/beta fold hydrolase [Ideonella aquatica]MBQ0961545.1 alpha/beta fold hydrolase [Ideonella aquatica]
MPPTVTPTIATTRIGRWPPALRRGAGLLAALALLGGLLWVLALVALWFGQERLLFHPVPLADTVALSREPDVSERFVEVPGARISVLELRRPRPDGVVFFLHGNSGHLKEWFTDGGPYRRANLDLVMMDYRGFGKSSGRIASQAQLQADVEAVWQSVAARYAGLRVIVYGRSLGSGLAAAWAAQHQPALTVLVSPYESMQALAAQHYPWVPSALLRYPLRSDQALAQQAPQARLVVIPGAAHDDVHRFASYQAVLARALSAP